MPRQGILLLFGALPGRCIEDCAKPFSTGGSVRGRNYRPPGQLPNK